MLRFSVIVFFLIALSSQSFAGDLNQNIRWTLSAPSILQDMELEREYRLAFAGLISSLPGEMRYYALIPAEDPHKPPKFVFVHDGKLKSYQYDDQEYKLRGFANLNPQKIHDNVTWTPDGRYMFLTIDGYLHFIDLEQQDIADGQLAIKPFSNIQIPPSGRAQRSQLALGKSGKFYSLLVAQRTPFFFKGMQGATFFPQFDPQEITKKSKLNRQFIPALAGRGRPYGGQYRNPTFQDYHFVDVHPKDPNLILLGTDAGFSLNYYDGQKICQVAFVPLDFSGQGSINYLAFDPQGKRIYLIFNERMSTYDMELSYTANVEHKKNHFDEKESLDVQLRLNHSALELPEFWYVQSCHWLDNSLLLNLAQEDGQSSQLVFVSYDRTPRVKIHFQSSRIKYAQFSSSGNLELWLDREVIYYRDYHDLKVGRLQRDFPLVTVRSSDRLDFEHLIDKLCKEVLEVLFLMLKELNDQAAEIQIRKDKPMQRTVIWQDKDFVTLDFSRESWIERSKKPTWRFFSERQQADALPRVNLQISDLALNLAPDLLGSYQLQGDSVFDGLSLMLISKVLSVRPDAVSLLQRSNLYQTVQKISKTLEDLIRNAREGLPADQNIQIDDLKFLENSNAHRISHQKFYAILQKTLQRSA